MTRSFLTLAVAAACGLAACSTAVAQESTGTADQSGQKKPATLQTVVVTGTRAFDRTASASLAPIDVLTPSEIVGTGAPDLKSALRILLPSFNFPQPSITDATDASQPAQLRGLSPDQTLVLINGKRQHNTAILNVVRTQGYGSSPVDLSAIPISAVQRIEVLRDGAAAQYGSDAIAGVINIILKGGADHGSANAGFGQYDGGQGDTWQGGADGGISLGNRGWVHLAANYLNQDPTNHAGPDPRYPGDPRNNTVTSHFGLPKMITRQAAINSQYNLGDNATLYAFGVYNQRHVFSPAFYRPFLSYAATQPAAAAVYPDGFLPSINSAMRDDNTVIGVRGDLAGWHYDLSADTGGNHWKAHSSDSFNYSLGAKSPISFYLGTLVLRQSDFNADFSRDLDLGWHGPLTVAWGLAYRRETFTMKQGDAASYAGAGAQAFPGFQPADASSHSRHDTAEYIDLEADVTQKFSAAFAARHERYSDFGNTTSWKLSGRYAFTPVIALRGTASTGFRAPSLQQEFYSSTAIDISNNGQTLLTVRTFPVSDPAAVALGAQPLKPEKSRNLSLGLVITPAVGPYVTLDAYQITIDDRIILSGNLTGQAVQNYLTSIGIPFVSGGRFFTNAVDTRTRGVDLIGTWPVQLAGSRIKFTGGLNYNKTDILSIKPNPPQLGLTGLVLPVIPRDVQGLITVGTPRTKAFVGADWALGGWNLRAQVTRYGQFSVRDEATVNPVRDQTFGAKVLLDASASYTLQRWTFTLGGNNITNQYPDKNNAANSFVGIRPYPLASPIGFSGVYWYGDVAYRW